MAVSISPVEVFSSPLVRELTISSPKVTNRPKTKSQVSKSPALDTAMPLWVPKDRVEAVKTAEVCHGEVGVLFFETGIECFTHGGGSLLKARTPLAHYLELLSRAMFRVLSKISFL